MTETVINTEHNVVNPVSTDSSGDVVTDPSGNPTGNISIGDGDGPLVAPSGYTGPTAVLTVAGAGIPVASGASKITVGVVTALAGPVLIAFGDDAADAVLNVQGGGTVASLLGQVIDLKVSDGVGAVGTVKIPRAYWKTDSTTPHFALAEAHGTPTGQLQVTQG